MWLERFPDSILPGTIHGAPAGLVVYDIIKIFLFSANFWIFDKKMPHSYARGRFCLQFG